MSVQPDATAAANVGLDEVFDASRARRLAAAGLLPSTEPPRTKATSFCTLLQAEGRVLVDWEASDATQAPRRKQKLTKKPLTAHANSLPILYARLASSGAHDEREINSN